MEYVKDLKKKYEKLSKEELLNHRKDMFVIVNNSAIRSTQEKYNKRADVCTNLLKKLGVKFDILGRII